MQNKIKKSTLLAIMLMIQPHTETFAKTNKNLVAFTKQIVGKDGKVKDQEYQVYSSKIRKLKEKSKLFNPNTEEGKKRIDKMNKKIEKKQEKIKIIADKLLMEKGNENLSGEELAKKVRNKRVRKTVGDIGINTVAAAVAIPTGGMSLMASGAINAASTALPMIYEEFIKNKDALTRRYQWEDVQPTDPEYNAQFPKFRNKLKSGVVYIKTEALKELEKKLAKKPKNKSLEEKIAVYKWKLSEVQDKILSAHNKYMQKGKSDKLLTEKEILEQTSTKKTMQVLEKIGMIVGMTALGTFTGRGASQAAKKAGKEVVEAAAKKTGKEIVEAASEKAVNHSDDLIRSTANGVDEIDEILKVQTVVKDADNTMAATRSTALKALDPLDGSIDEIKTLTKSKEVITNELSRLTAESSVINKDIQNLEKSMAKKPGKQLSSIDKRQMKKNKELADMFEQNKKKLSELEQKITENRDMIAKKQNEFNALEKTINDLEQIKEKPAIPTQIDSQTNAATKKTTEIPQNQLMPENPNNTDSVMNNKSTATNTISDNAAQPKPDLVPNKTNNSALPLTASHKKIEHWAPWNNREFNDFAKSAYNQFITKNSQVIAKNQEMLKIIKHRPRHNGSLFEFAEKMRKIAKSAGNSELIGSINQLENSVAFNHFQDYSTKIKLYIDFLTNQGTHQDTIKPLQKRLQNNLKTMKNLDPTAYEQLSTRINFTLDSLNKNKNKIDDFFDFLENSMNDKPFIDYLKSENELKIKDWQKLTNAADTGGVMSQVVKNVSKIFDPFTSTINKLFTSAHKTAKESLEKIWTAAMKGKTTAVPFTETLEKSQTKLTSLSTMMENLTRTHLKQLDEFKLIDVTKLNSYLENVKNVPVLKAFSGYCTSIETQMGNIFQEISNKVGVKKESLALLFNTIKALGARATHLANSLSDSNTTGIPTQTGTEQPADTTTTPVEAQPADTNADTTTPGTTQPADANK